MSENGTPHQPRTRGSAAGRATTAKNQDISSRTAGNERQICHERVSRPILSLAVMTVRKQKS